MADRRTDYRSELGYSPGATYFDACEEALRCGDRKVGTDHLLLALLRDAACAQAVGHDLAQARVALDAIDMAALAAVGIDAAACTPPALEGRQRDRLPLTPAAKHALQQAGKVAGSRRFGPLHLLQALAQNPAPDPAKALLARLGVDKVQLVSTLKQA